MATFDSALSRVLPYAPGCPDVTATFHLVQAAITFFARTLAWRVTLDDVLTEVGVTQYAFPLPAGSALVKLLKYSLDGDDSCNVVDPDKGERLLANNHSHDVVWTDDRINFHVSPAPIEDDLPMSLTVALKPTQAATTLDAALFEHYIDAIATGALARILMLPKQPWTDKATASDKEIAFNDAIARTASAVSRGTARSKQRSKPFTF
jgi:hypothetical protein